MVQILLLFLAVGQKTLMKVLTNALLSGKEYARKRRRKLKAISRHSELRVPYFIHIFEYQSFNFMQNAPFEC